MSAQQQEPNDHPAEQPLSPAFSECAEVMAERQWGESGAKMALSNYSQKYIEQKEKELQE
jgi:hypothetical protein